MRLIVSDSRVGSGQPENQVRDGEVHGVGDHAETEERAQSAEGGRCYLLLAARHVRQPVSLCQCSVTRVCVLSTLRSPSK